MTILPAFNLRGKLINGFPLAISTGLQWQFFHAYAFFANAIFCYSLSFAIRIMQSKGGAASIFLIQHWDKIASCAVISVVVLFQSCRCIADIRKAEGSSPHALPHVKLQLQYPNGSLPVRLCVDEKPWQPSQLTARMLMNEDWGCETRYKSRAPK